MSRFLTWLAANCTKGNTCRKAHSKVEFGIDGRVDLANHCLDMFSAKACLIKFSFYYADTPETGFSDRTFGKRHVQDEPGKDAFQESEE